jgi:hypothetical protein
MHDQPRNAACRRFVRPDPNEIRGGITEEAREFGNTHVVGRCPQLDKGIVAPQGYACAIQRLSHEEWARRRRGTCEGDQIVAGQSLASPRGLRFLQIPFRRIERVTDLAELATDKIRRGGAREPDREIGVTPRYVE